MIPAHRVAQCEDCDIAVDIEAPGIAQAVSGWAVNRTQGGPNRIACRKAEPRWLCHPCLDRRVRGDDPNQSSLL